jgi:hypothetical protein
LLPLSVQKGTTRLCAVAALREQAQTPLPPTEREAFDQIVATARSALDEQVFVSEWNTRTVLTQDDALSDLSGYH